MLRVSHDQITFRKIYSFAAIVKSSCDFYFMPFTTFVSVTYPITRISTLKAFIRKQKKLVSQKQTEFVMPA